MWLCRRLGCIEFLGLLPYPQLSSSLLHESRAVQQCPDCVHRLRAQRCASEACPLLSPCLQDRLSSHLITPAAAYKMLPRLSQLPFHEQKNLATNLDSRGKKIYIYYIAALSHGVVPSCDPGARALKFLIMKFLWKSSLRYRCI